MGKVYEDEIEFANINGGKWTQGWNIGLDLAHETDPENLLRVFVVPHSHNDPGNSIHIHSTHTVTQYRT